MQALLRRTSRFLQLDNAGRWPQSAKIAIERSWVYITAWRSFSQKPLLALDLKVQMADFVNVATTLGLSHVDALIMTDHYNEDDNYDDSFLSDIFLTKEIWQIWLRELHSLTTLDVTLDDVEPFLFSLKNGPSAVPMLRKLVLREVDFSLPGTMKMPDYLIDMLPAEEAQISVDGQAFSPRELLCSAVQWRHEAGAGLHLLSLRRCRDIDGHTMDVLKQVVDEVEWLPDD